MQARLLALLAVAGLAACDAAGLVSAFQLRDVDPARTDPAALRVAAVLPDGVRPRANEVRLLAMIENGGQTRTYRIGLRPVAIDDDAARISGAGQVHAYRIAPADLPEFGRFRVAALAARAAGGGGSLSVEAPPCRTTATPPRDLPLSIWLNAAETDGYVLLARLPDLLSQARAAGEDLPVPPCAG